MEPRSAFVQVQGVRIHYVDWGGDGPPLVLLHGGRLFSHSWDAVARGLRKDFRCIAMDARGHGDSDWPARGYTESQRVADLDAFLDIMRLDHPYGMGHSRGSMTMGMHGAARPGRFAKLVLIEPPARPFGRPPGAAPAQPGAGPAQPTPAQVGPAMQRLMRRGPAAQRRVWPSRPELEAYLRKHPETGLWREDVLHDVVRHGAAQKSDGSVEMKWSLAAYNPEDAALNTTSFPQEAPKVTAPVLLMYGTKGVALEEDYRALAASLPHADLVVVESAGHNIYMEDPEIVIEAAHPFFLSAEPTAHGESRVRMHDERVLASGARTV